MVPLGDKAQVEALIGPFADSDNLDANRAPNVPSAQKSFWTHPMVLLGDETQVKARFGPFGESANPDTR